MMGHHSRFDIALFDLDGTVADTLPLIYEAFNDALAPEFGRQLADVEIRQMFGPPDHEMIRRVVTAEKTAESFERYLSTYRRRHADLVTVFDGIHELLSDARAVGVRIGIVTGKSRETAIYTLEQLDLSNLVDVVVGGDDVVNHKPDPEGLLLAIGELGGDEVQHSAYAGDSAADIVAGKAAGIATIGVLWGSPDHAELLAAGPDYLCQSTGDLREVLLGESVET
jgi:2-phosphoglycolate phosphatase